MTTSAPSKFRRVEVKYPHASVAVLSGAVQALRARPQHAARTVNSIYFDSAELRDHEDGEEGITPRSKLRLRWYGPAELTFPFSGQLERKTTLAAGREKSVHPVQAADLPALRAALGALVPAWVRPQLQVSYERRYFVVGEGRARVTLDLRIRYRACPAIGRAGLAWADDALSVLEIKAEARQGRVFSDVGLVESRFSKYCRGIVRLRGTVEALA